MRRLAILVVLVSCGHDSTGSRDAPASIDVSAGGDGPGGGDGSTAGVACGMSTCTSGMECCVTFEAMMPVYNCIASGGTCMGVTQSCDGPEDCMSGQRCCASIGGTGGDVTCEMGGGTCRELCHTAMDCSMTGAMCCTSQFFNYSYCAMFCPQ